jgi:hypothetical protein
VRLSPSDRAEGQPLPVRFIGDRPYAAPVSARGDTLLLFLDTGGGANMLYPRSRARLGLAAEWVRDGNDSVRFAALPPFIAGAAVPLPGAASPWGERLIVMAPGDSADRTDGMLGRTWFADRIWRLDYPDRRLSLLDHGTSSSGDAHRVPLGFQVDSAGRRTTHFPRIRVAVDGDSLDLLFDTGATVSLTDGALTALSGDGGSRERGTSFIAASMFARWHQRHPDWRVVEHADGLLDMPMIQVPEVRVGGYAVGPAWFTMRPDRNFHEFMSQWMDRRVEGALGGSVLRFFRVTLDYPAGTATFER